MRKTTKWAKVFSVLLVFALVVFTGWSSHGKGKKAPKEPKGKTHMDAIAWDGGCVNPEDPLSPLISGDTTNIGLCPNAGTDIPSNNRGFYTRFGACSDGLTLAGENLTFEDGDGDDIYIYEVGLSVGQNRNNGEIVSIGIWLYDLDQNV